MLKKIGCKLISSLTRGRCNNGFFHGAAFAGRSRRREKKAREEREQRARERAQSYEDNLSSQTPSYPPLEIVFLLRRL